MELFARLDSTDLRVLCSSGDRTCRGELACIQIVKGKRLLCMLDGWKHVRGGRWAESNHSARRRRGAGAAVAMGTLAPAQLQARAAPRFRQPIPTEVDTNRTVYGLAADNYVVYPLGKGILATCPRCGHDNRLSAAHLRVATK